jgi:hypothetical protein
MCSNCCDRWLLGNLRCPRCGLNSTPNTTDSLHPSSSHLPLCPKHRKPADYFCQTCNSALCGDCLLEQVTTNRTDHTGHSVIRASEHLQHVRANLRHENELLQSSLSTLDEALERIRTDAQDSISFADDPTIVISAVFQDFRQRFEDAVVKHKEIYVSQLTELQKQASIVQNLVDEAELLLTNEDYRTAIKIQTFLGKLGEQIEILKGAEIPVSPGFVQNELLPPFEVMPIEIHDFPAVVERFRTIGSEGVRFIYTEKKKMYGGIWRAKIYPCGNANGLGTHLSVFLELLKGVKEPIEFVYRFALFHCKDSSKSVIRDYCSQYRELDSWGWNKAIGLIDILNDSNFLFGEGKVLRFELAIRPESYKVLYELTSSSYVRMKQKYCVLQDKVEESSTNM